VFVSTVDGIMAGSFAIRQSKTILGAILGLFEISRVFMCFDHVDRDTEAV